jgi:hypothetical protein
MEEEQGNKINFLDITICREATEISYSIYRKTFNYLFNRINCYPLTHNDKKE